MNKKLYRVIGTNTYYTSFETNEIGYVRLFNIVDKTTGESLQNDILPSNHVYIQTIVIYRNPQHIIDIREIKINGILIGYNDEPFNITLDDLAVSNQHSVIIEDYHFNAKRHDKLYLCTNLDMTSIDESKTVRVYVDTEVIYYEEEQNDNCVSGILVTVTYFGKLYQVCKSLLRIKPVNPIVETQKTDDYQVGEILYVCQKVAGTPLEIDTVVVYISEWRDTDMIDEIAVKVEYNKQYYGISKSLLSRKPNF